MADAAHAHHRHAVLFRHLDGAIHAQLGRHVSGTIVAVENGAAGAGFFKGEMRVIVGAAFADAFGIVFDPDRAVRMNAARIGMNQHVGDDAGVFLAQAGGVNFCWIS